MKRIVSAGLALAVLGGAFAQTPAVAAEGRNAALFGGLAAGALIGGALMGATRPAYAEPAPPPVVVYEEPAPIVCHRERRPLFDEFGDVAGYRTVKVCQ